MPRSTHLLFLAVAVASAICPSLHAEPAPDTATTPHFWDEIPVSPSTSMPREIRDGYWHGQFQRVNREVARADQPQVVFFGDSITWNWSLGSRTGTGVWEEEFSDFNPINMGNSGDITPVMLYRLTHGNLDFADGSQPEVAVLLCGTNNFVVMQSAGGEVRWELGPDCPPDEVAAGARAIAQVFRRRLPKTRVIMMGILPVANQAKWSKCQQVNAAHAAHTYNRDEVTYLDLQDKFLRPGGSLDQRLFTDGTHLTAEGYQVWAESITPHVTRMMQAEPLAPVRIMLVGDSITEGTSSATSYRRYLDGMLRREGMLIDFVGSRRKHHDDQAEPDSFEYDVDHEGHWGKDSAWLAKNLPELLSGDAPDVAVIHMGTEDIVSAQSADPESTSDEITGNISKVVDALRAQNKGVKIVLAKIIPVPGKADEVDRLNRQISRYASAHSTGLSPVEVAPLPAGFDASQDLADGGFLPSPSGAEKVAGAIAAAVNKVVGAQAR